MTKCGRYGMKQSEFDYSPATIRASVKRSLERLHTDYLDAVYLHDVEFVCAPVGPSSGNHLAALSDQSAEYGLGQGQEGKIWGAGDQIILNAVAELRRLQEEGVVKHVGISGTYLHPLGSAAPAHFGARFARLMGGLIRSLRVPAPHAPSARAARTAYATVQAA